MISHLRGRLARKNELASSVEVDVGGVWYRVELPAFVWRALEERDVGEEIELETFYFVTQNAPIPRLIGFQREVEREFFEKLVTVPNVGPTTATKALVFSVSTIARWIEAGDTASLAKLPGVGKRTAETIVAQLRGKVTEEALLADERFASPEPPRPAGPSEVARDAIDALVALGYSRGEAERLVGQVEAESEPATVEEAIRAVFRKLNPV
ncbi:MAG TPA: Holliday junction branch migration protein RuvA [Dehalococcoidia bacterium]|nr:Holliday junction branch migration protein RuvA [Dehalococcoidia bacterium]